MVCCTSLVSCYIRGMHMFPCCGSLTLREQPKTKCLSDRMSGVHHRQEMKFTLLPTQQLSALVNENILKIKAKYSTYHQTKLQLRALWFPVNKVVSTSTKEVYLLRVENNQAYFSHSFTERSSFSLTNTSLKTTFLVFGVL